MIKHISLLCAVFFLYILFFLVLPPIFCAYSPDNTPKPEVSPDILAHYVLLIFCMLYFSKHASTTNNSAEKQISLCNSIIYTIIGFICLSVITFLLIKINPPMLPHAEFSYDNALLFFFSVVILACFEEILYRRFLPDVAKALLDQVFPLPYARFRSVAIEAAVLLLFALAHRYLGLLTVLNALLCGAVLRFTAKKTGTIISTCFIHSVYNLCTFLLYMRQ